MAGGFFLGPDHHPKMDTNSTPELAKWLQVSEEVFHCCYSKSCDPKYQGFFGLVTGNCAERWQFTRNSAQDPAREIVVWLWYLTVSLHDRAER